MAIKKKAHEKLDDKNIQRLINALNGENSITKKDACEMLHINYNTPRLSKIIKNYRDEKAYRQKRMDRNRGKPATKDEKKEIISQYLIGMSITAIAKGMYRSTPFIKSFIESKHLSICFSSLLVIIIAVISAGAFLKLLLVSIIFIFSQKIIIDN